MQRRTLLVILLALCFAVAPTGPSLAAENTAAVDPKAEKILNAALDYLEAAGRFAFHAEENVDRLLPGGLKVMYSGSLDMTVRRPDRLRASYTGDLQRAEARYDGKSFTLMDLNNNTYAACPAPATLDGLVDDLKREQGFRLPLSNLLRTGLAAKAREDVRGGLYVGLHGVGGIACHHLAFSQDNIDWQVWVEEGKQPLLRKIVISFKNRPGSPQYEAVFSGWEFPPELGDGLFGFEPPEGAVKADFLGMRGN
jgi:hypothetical protein